ncbi:hypothetical protein GMORB2_0606 [Geosmithia morbida]|uniref:Uncharacterized protein n=1 Tax=Geosmithia morbida TaxID=1094350 RepID=A0A9P4Z556_9HYPO|nr:uncharacterized protein GMORB2_0606 [Geosmithia morbida]KAF4126869.1 hypothetical protein GMORB2_0606 [Geosmithia morbida]
MSSLGPPGPGAHGLNFNPAGLRRNPGFPPPHPAQPNKQSPVPHTASPYQSQYAPQHPPQQYPHHLFAPQVNGNVPNGASRAPNAHPQNVLGVQHSSPSPSTGTGTGTGPGTGTGTGTGTSTGTGTGTGPGPGSSTGSSTGSDSDASTGNAAGTGTGTAGQGRPRPSHSTAEAEAEVSGLDSRLLDDPSYVPTQPMGEMMSPPPEGGSYPTLEAVQKAVLRYCTSVGYAIVIGRSKKTLPGLKKVLFVCDRAGKPPNRVSPEFRKRKTSSRKCDCPFGFFAIEQRTQWTIRYRPDKTSEEKLRRELAKVKEDFKKMEEDKQKQIDELKSKIEEKDQMIHKFETFIDICNQRVMVQRERLEGGQSGGGNLP